MRRKEYIRKCLEKIKELRNRGLLAMFSTPDNAVIMTSLENSMKIDELYGFLMDWLSSLKTVKQYKTDGNGKVKDYEGTKEYAQGYDVGRREALEGFVEWYKDMFNLENEEDLFRTLDEERQKANEDAEPISEINIQLSNNSINYQITKKINGKVMIDNGRKQE